MLELAGILIIGIIAQWVAWRINIPAILPLILIGLAFGPLSTFITVDGTKMIEPMYDAHHQNGLFPGELLFNFVSLAIGIILFEGGLTLNMKEVSEVGQVISRIISIGSLVTFIGGGIGVHYILDLNWELSYLFSGLIIVTGPTVIAPILRSLPLNKNVSTVLKWEGILIDPIGALVAVLVYDFIISGEEGNFTFVAIGAFLKIVVVGVSLGFTAAHFLAWMIRKKMVPHYLLNIFALALVLGVYVSADIMAHESGLLATVVMGMVLGNLDVSEVKGILDFKEALSILLISILFILLSANIDIEHLQLIANWNLALLFLFVILILRPLGIFASTIKSPLSIREKLFISWVGPRGIVAAGVASLFGMKLTGKVAGAEYIAPLVFMIVAGTVLINATTAKLVARYLGVLKTSGEGIVILGANEAARLIAKYLVGKKKELTIIDRSEPMIAKAKQDGIPSLQLDIYKDDLDDYFPIVDSNTFMAMTPSEDVNKHAIGLFKGKKNIKNAYRLISESELKSNKKSYVPPVDGLFSCVDDYINVSETVRDFPSIHEVEIKSPDHFQVVFASVLKESTTVPLFLWKKDELVIVSSRKENLSAAEGDIFVYLGKKIELKYSTESIKEEEE